MEARNSVSEADVVVSIVDATEPQAHFESLGLLVTHALLNRNLHRMQQLGSLASTDLDD